MILYATHDRLIPKAKTRPAHHTPTLPTPYPCSLPDKEATGEVFSKKSGSVGGG